MHLETPLGHIEVQSTLTGVVSVRFVDAILCPRPQGSLALASGTAAWIRSYFMGQKDSFSLPLAPLGSPFQRSVWQALTQIPYGETRTYEQIASQIGRPSAIRAVATAIARNHCLLCIPCHRVVRKNGTIGGFSAGRSRKSALIHFEKTGSFH